MVKFAMSLIALGTAILPTYASAHTECPVHILKIWSGDGGAIWLHFAEGGAMHIDVNEPNKVSVLSMGMTALAGGWTMTIRYSQDGADCTVYGRTDFLGAYIN